MQKKLTAKQNKFIDGILSGMTQSDAYRAAYNCGNMQSDTIINKAYQLARRDDIRAVIERKQKKLEDTAIWERKHALEMLQRIADADIKDFLAFKTAKTVVSHDDDTGEPIIDYNHIVDLMDSKNVDGRLIQEISISKDGTLKFKLCDKLKAAEMANKMCGYNEPERGEVDVNINNESIDVMLRLAGYKKDD